MAESSVLNKDSVDKRSPANRADDDDEDGKWLSLFPAELWEVIVRSVEDPDIMYSIDQASPFLKSFLSPNQRSTYLLCQVLKVRDDNHRQSSSSLRHKPTLCRYLEEKDVLKCRLVCSSWNRAVCRFLEARPHLPTVSGFPPFGNSGYPTYPAAAFRLQKYRDPESWASVLAQISAFSHFYRAHPETSSPSPARHLEIKEDVVGARPLMVDFVRTFLQQVGPNFSHLTIQVGSNTLIGEYLELMPNLRSLSASWNDGAYFRYTGVVAGTFPTLRNLNRICLVHAPSSLTKWILEANAGAKVVEICQRRGASGNVPLSANPTSFSTIITSVDELFGIPVTWKLVILHLSFSPDVDFIKWSTIFRKVEWYQETLLELRLELPSPDKGTPSQVGNVWETSRSPLDLGVLKRLEVMVGNYCSLDFLLGLGSLEYLSLRLLEHNEQAKREMVKEFFVETINFNLRFPERFMECNIWKRMGKLREVDLGLGRQSVQHFKRGQELKSDHEMKIAHF